MKLAAALLILLSLSETALRTPGEWQESETEHFVYHFTDPKSAETVWTHAESTYDWIKRTLGIEEDNWPKKSHVYVFEDKGVWESFVRETMPVLEGTAFTTGHELFMYRDPFWLSPMKTIAHELTHVIVFRFLDGPIPLFLNEGFAEYVSYKALAVRFDGDEYRLHTIQSVPADAYIPLEELASFQTYPGERTGVFYLESELFVRFLIARKPARVFYAFLKEISAGASFEEALQKFYETDLVSLEESFKKSALDRVKP